VERPLPTRPAIRTGSVNWELWIGAALGCLAVSGYVIAGWGAPTVYDYYGRLADAFVHGRYWLLDDPAWLNELLSCGDGKWCVAYPPLPAILSIPLLPFGTATAQDLVSQLCGGASAGVLYLALRAYGAPRWVAVTGTLLSAFGTTLLFSSADGRAWYAAHAVAMLLDMFGCRVFGRERRCQHEIDAVLPHQIASRFAISRLKPRIRRSRKPERLAVIKLGLLRIADVKLNVMYLF